jgi:hypothetical protein
MRGRPLLGGFLVLVVLAAALASIVQPIAAKDQDTPNTINAELIGQIYNPSLRLKRSTATSAT